MENNAVDASVGMAIEGKDIDAKKKCGRYPNYLTRRAGPGRWSVARPPSRGYA